MNIKQGVPVSVLLFGEVASIALALVTRVLPDPDTGNTDTGVAPVLCDVTVLSQRAPWSTTVYVYDARSAGGNAALDAHGFGFVTDDVSAAVPSGVRIPPPAPHTTTVHEVKK